MVSSSNNVHSYFCKNTGVKLYNIVFALLISLAVFLGSSSYFSNFLIESGHQLIFQGFFPLDSRITVFSENSAGKRDVVDVIEVQGKAPHVDQRFIVNLEGKHINKLGFEVSTEKLTGSNDSIHLHFIKVVNSFTEDLFLAHTEIRNFFLSEQFAGDEINRLDFSDNDGKISMVSKELSNPPNTIFTEVLPLFLALMAFLLLMKTRVSNLSAIQDMRAGRLMTQPAQFDAINGIRGLSAILVLFSHTAPGFASIRMGLALLFVMSGFLLSKPFVLAADRIFCIKTIHAYIVKRAKRIVPMYYFTVFIVYLVSFEFDTAARHFLFIEARGHLWAIPQILAFYLLLPGILLATSLFHKFHRAASVALLVTLILIWKHYASFPLLFYNGSYHTSFMLDAFLLGVTAAYVQYGLIQPSKRVQSILAARSAWISITALIFTILCLAWSAPVEPPAAIAHLMDRFDVKCLLAAIIILFAVNTPQTLYARVIGNPVFRSIGIIGFSFYLLQGLGIDIVLQFQKNILGHEELVFRSWKLTFSVLALTYIISLFTYSYIERPFFGKKQK